MIYIYIARCVCANFLSIYQETERMIVRSPCHICPLLQVLDYLPDAYKIYQDFAIGTPQKL